MPLFLDVHTKVEGRPEEVEQEHLKDLEAQDQFGVRYLRFWFNQEAGHVFCLVEGPNVDACKAVHVKSHGNTADRILEVDPLMIDAFLGGGSKTERDLALDPEGRVDEGFRTIFFSDIVGSTHLLERFGDDGWLKMVRLHDGIVRDALVTMRGREIKHTGDGIMASFHSAAAAVRSAVQVQERLAKANANFDVRIGLNAGEPLTIAGDLFGVAVNVARRLCEKSAAREILVASAVRDLCAGKSFRFVDRGELSLVGFNEPMHAYAVDWQSGETAPPS